MSDYSSVSDLGRGSEVGASSDVSETNNNVDFGDGDGINEFDESDAQTSPEDFDYHVHEDGNEIDPKKDEVSLEETTVKEMSSDEYADSVSNDFENDIEDDYNDSSETLDDDSNDISDEQSDEYADLGEKNAYFENASYQQGQNEFGYLGTCGPTSISNSLNRVAGTSEYSENKVLGNAIDNNLCYKSEDPYSSGGTTTKDVVNIIDNVKNPESNVHTEVYEYDKILSSDDLANRIDNPGTVAMVGVDSASLWDQRGDVADSGLFNDTESPSDHWITVDSPIRDDNGNVTGFNVIDSGGGVDYVDRDKFESMYMGDSEHTISDPTVIIISNQGEAANTYVTSEDIERTSNYK